MTKGAKGLKIHNRHRSRTKDYTTWVNIYKIPIHWSPTRGPMIGLYLGPIKRAILAYAS